MKKEMRNKAQIMGIPYSMIFSIILIMVFIFAAIYAISIFINPKACALSDTAQQGAIKTDLQDIINEMWASEGGSYPDFEKAVSGKIQAICFLDLSEDEKGRYDERYDELKRYGKGNFYFYPPKNACKGFKAMTLNHINLTWITRNDNPYCIPSKKGKINPILEMGYYENLVKIS